MLIIGERINTSRKRVAPAVESKNENFIREEAAMQRDAGANFIDANAGTFVTREIELLTWIVKTIQENVDMPVSIDSPNPKAIEAALKIHKGKAFINSISLEKQRYEGIIALAREYKTNLVSLTIDETGMPETTEKKVEIGSKLIDKLTKDGIAIDNIYLDPLVFPIGTNSNNGMATLNAMEQIKLRYPEVHLTCGASNISFGLPFRKLINRTFIAMAVLKGLDGAIIDPCDKELMASIIAAEALSGKDEYCANYIGAHRDGKLAVAE